MQRAAVLVLALLLVPAARADAKFSSARVCGPSDCHGVAITEGHTLLTIGEGAFSTRSRLASKPPEASPWYRVTLCPGPCNSPHAFTLKVLPTDGYEYLPPKEQGHRKGWAKLDQHATEVYRRITMGLEPFPPSRLLVLGATEPSPVPGGDSGARREIPAWAWIAIATAAAALALLSVRWLRQPRRAPPAT